MSRVQFLSPPFLNLKTESAPDTVLAESGAYLFSEDSQEGFRKVSQTSAKVPQLTTRSVEAAFLTVAQAAERLGTWPSTITRWCESGKLPAIPKSYGSKTSYLIVPTAIDMVLAQRESAKSKKQNHKQAQSKLHPEFVKAWVSAMSTGLLTGKPYSKRVIEDYEKYIGLYFKHCKTVSIDGLKVGLAKIPVESVAKRQHFYKAVRCFAKYLISEGVLESGFIEGIKLLAPRYHRPPKRHSVTAEELESLIKACDTVLDRTLVILLASTGLRASELCVLQYRDISLQQGFLTVCCGKGGKTRKVGLNADCRQALALYLPKQPSKVTKNVFLNIYGKPMDRNGLYQRLERLGKLAGIKVSPHSLRRAFVTINANAGRPLQMLQMACGHSDIKTTMSYCRTSEQEVIEAMKGWD